MAIIFLVGGILNELVVWRQTNNFLRMAKPAAICNDEIIEKSLS